MKTPFLSLIFLCLSPLTFAEIKQVHCPDPENNHILVADPAIVSTEDEVLVMGTGDVLMWKDLKALVSGDKAQKKRLELFKESAGEVTPLGPGELPWDLQIYDLEGESYLYGGVMTPLPGMQDARWPEENISRRIKVATFDKKLEGWVFREEPVFGKADHDSWPGHSYGQQIIKEKGKTYMLHEEISRDGITELFIRKMITPFKASKAKKILGIEDLALSETVRVDGGHLLEGPRYTKISLEGKEVHLVFFSTGDFPTKNYTTRVAYSLESIEGPYTVVKNKGKALDLTQPAQELGLHGVGRAFPFEHDGKNWIIFHGAKDLPGTNHEVWPQNLDYFQRCLFVAPLEVHLNENELQIAI